ncbi:MAG: hypothetical protein ACJ0BN_01765 [Limisphaerales bacterium]
MQTESGCRVCHQLLEHGALALRTSNATGRMLNGMVRTDAASLDPWMTSPSEIALYGLPAGTHSLIVYTVQVPLEFYTLDLEVEDSNGTQRRYLRPENSDEYKPSPNFRLVTSEESSERSVGNMAIFRGLSPQNGEVTLRFSRARRWRSAGTWDQWSANPFGQGLCAASNHQCAPRLIQWRQR